MRYRVRHSTLYRYADPVDLAAHQLHLTPRARPGQRVLEAGLEAVPTPSRTTHAMDHFGNPVTWMFLDRPHDRFEVTVEATVDVCFPAPPAPGTTPPWEDVAALAMTDPHAAEFIFDSPMVPPVPAAAEYARRSFPAGRPVLEGLLDLNRRIRREFAFRPGVTEVFTPVARVMELRAGVCQDFTHVMICGLRGLGLPARYVSGYLRTKPPAGQPVRRGADQSHAWVGAWMGPDLGWVDLDPTNDLVVRDEHVVLAWGRDYSDISPVCGVILGGGRHTVSVGVDLDPLETAEAAAE